MERRNKETSIGTVSVVEENIDACEIPAVGMKYISNFVTGNQSFRKKCKTKKKKKRKNNENITMITIH